MYKRQVTNQVIYQGRERIRADIILYVNGIPLVNIECKDPTKPGVSWFDAFKQIKDYESIVPELYKYVQIGVAVESKAKYFPIVPWLSVNEVHTYEWKVENKDSVDAVIEMLSQEILLDIIKNFLFYRIERGNAGKVITRYMQYRSANKIVERVKNNIKGVEEKNKGLIWHWQGSGKTLTMIFSANKLYFLKELENPTIFFIVDRIELEDQLNTEFSSLDIVKPEIIGSIKALEKVLSFDNYKGKRGLFIVLIHKFRPEELKDLQNIMEKISENIETIMTRKNVITFIDEGHRSQYGILASQMRSILKNAFFFAFTGTPISKRNRSTYREFSYPPKEYYLDKYFITDSIEDGFTVKIVYQPRLEKDVHLKKDLLEAFLEYEFEEIPEEIKEEVEEKVRKKLNYIKLFLEDKERIKVIAEDIANHFKENFDGKFKGMIVAGSRKACVIYENELAKHLPDKYFKVVMTESERESDPLLARHVAETKEKYGFKDISDIRKDIIIKFKEEEFPRILIVTDMLLTGFDAPILQVMYLDKPLKEHRLLQAIARTNRPFKGLKEAGIIIDYVGILKEFRKALEMYSVEDIKNVILDYGSLEREFTILINEILEIFKGIPRDFERETLLKAIEILTTDERKGEEFIEKYRSLRKIFELLGPHEVKLNYFETYKWISGIYTYYMKVVLQSPSVDAYVQKFFEKTIRFVHKSVEIKELDKELPIISFDENYLRKLEERVKSRKEKAVNMLFTLQRFVLVERHKNPVYESLVDKVERLIQLWKEKTKDYKRIYIEGAKIIEEMNQLTARQKNLGFSNFEYSILLSLEGKLGKREELVDEVRKLSKSIQKYLFPGWLNQVTIRKDVERTVRRFVIKLKSKYKFSFKEMDELYKKLIDSVKNYAE